MMWVTVAGRWGWGLQTALPRGGFRQDPNTDKTLGVETEILLISNKKPQTKVSLRGRK